MNLRIPILSILLLISTLTCRFSTSFAQGTAFTYQGRLSDGASPAAGIYDFRFRIAADSAGNNLVAGPLLTNAVPVNNGLFTLALDFGAGLFTGSNYWLQVDVKTNGAASYTTLTPLQALTPAPYAIFANGSSNVFGAVPAAQLSGTIASSRLAGPYANALNFNNPANQFAGIFSGNGAGVSNVNAATLNGLAATNFWKTAGNSGTTPNANFLGTTDNQPLEFRINGERVLRLTPNLNGGPNFLGGSSANLIAPGVVGGIIVGGGSLSYFGTPYTNSLASDFGFIGGGGSHTIGTNSPFATIVAGSGNQLGNNNSHPFIGGGLQNQIGDSSGFGTISGGLANQIGTNSPQTTIAGGGTDSIGSNASEATIGGGGGNRILDGSGAGTIAGGSSNQILTNSSFATIGGGLINHIGPSADYSFIGGGNRNTILTNSQCATIAGGSQNSVLTNSSFGTIAGGSFNTIQGFASYATIVGGTSNTNDAYGAVIGGGDFNQIQIAADHALIAGGGNNTIVGSFSLPVYDAIGGGNWNTMQTNTSFSVIAGGQSNLITAGAAYSTIGGGAANLIFLGAANATISGGSNNVVSANGATVVGGLGNSALSPGSVAMGISSTAHGFAATAMGQNSTATGNASLAAGDGAQATNNGAFVWTDPTGFGFSSTNDNSFNVHASGGVRFVTSGAGVSVDGPLSLNGTFNQPLELLANGLPALRLKPMPNDLDDSNIVNVIAGSPANFVLDGAFGATIAGGGAANYYGSRGSNSVLGDFGTVGGGEANISGNGGTVAGGEANTAAGAMSAIGGGSGNFADHFNSVIAGGFGNTNGGNYASIGGGLHNTNSGQYATIPGGSDNFAGGDYSFAAGQRAKANHDGTFVWADFENADFASTHSNQFLIRASAGVGIGKNNPVSALDVNGVVTAINFSGSGSGLTGVAPASGSANYIQNQTAINQPASFRINGNGIFNGGNVAIGTTAASTALHVRDTSDTEISIQSNDVGAHRWTLQSSGVSGNPNLDASFQIIDRTSNNSRFLIGTNGFVGIGTSGPTNRLHVNGGVSATAFVNTSDRNAKENFAPVSAREVLDKVAALPISTWNYKEMHDGRHMGPMAQDFYAAFHLGGSEKTITTVDPDGVALAAIQGLNEKVESAVHKSEERIRELEAENAELKRRLEAENAEVKRRLQALETVLISQKSN